MATRWLRRARAVSVVAIALAAAPAAAQSGPPLDWSPPVQAAASERSRPAESSMPLVPTPPPATAPGDGGPPASPASSGWARTVGSVALVVGLIVVLAALARFAARRSGSVAAMLGPGGRAPSGVLEVLARYPISRSQTLVLLRVDRRVLLLSQSSAGRGEGFSTLAEFDDPGEVAAILQQTRDEASESISTRFRQALEQFGQGEPSDTYERGEIIEVSPRGGGAWA
ncbi:MAG: flagellar biosynthetic protein FliO [Planctomycetota bacterium]